MCSANVTSFTQKLSGANLFTFLKCEQIWRQIQSLEHKIQVILISIQFGFHCKAASTLFLTFKINSDMYILIISIMNKNRRSKHHSPVFFKWTHKSIFETVLIVLLFSVLILEKSKQRRVLNNVYVDFKVQQEVPYLLGLILEQGQYPAETYSVFSHGRSGQLFIEGAWLEAPQIAAFFKGEIGSAKNLHIYGCEFAKGKKGRAAVAYLKETLRVEIAASTNSTGQDGDWVLEVQTKEQPVKTLAFATLQITLQDSDNDGVNDNLDIDDDNDGILDVDEGNCTITSGFDAYYPFENSTNDVSGNNHHQQNTTSTLYSTDVISGANSISFDGSYFLHYSTSGSFLEQEINNFTYALWIKPTSLSGIQFIFDEGGGTTGVAMRLNGNVLQAAVKENGTLVNLNSHNFPDDGAWHHVALTYANGVVVLYLDGVTSGTTNTGFGSLRGHNGNSGLGNANTGSAFGGSGAYIGLMDDFYHYPIALNNQQINAFLNVGLEQCDLDSDGIPNAFDLDADNDGIPDNIEAQSTTGYIAPTGTDTDGDGLDDAYDVDNGGTAIIPVNTDGTGEADFLDLDADDDGVFDIVESGSGLTDGNTDGMTDGAVGVNGLDNSLEISDDYTDVNGSFDTTQTNNFTDTDTDVLTFGDVDYRDAFLSGIALITQVYQSATDRWIEITNVHASNSIEANAIKLSLFGNSSGDQTGSTPTAIYTYSATLDPGISVLLHNSTATISNTNTAAVLVSENSMTSYAGANDIFVLSSSTNNLAYEKRYDEVYNITDTSSFVRNDAVLTPTKNFNSVQWTVFADDALDPDTNPPERHVQAPLISEIATANTAANIQLGLHRIGATTRIGSAWSNGFPDRSRQLVIAENFEQSTQLNTKELEVNNGVSLTITNNLLVVSDALVNNGTLRMAGTSQLVQTHTNTTLVSGAGNLQIDQFTTLASIYRFNYWTAPVVENGSSTFSIGAVLKDGTIPTSSSSAIIDINFVGGYDGANTSPISIPTYWLYSYTNGGWDRTGNTGDLNPTDGYLLKGPGVAQNYTFTGAPNDGVITTVIAASASKLLGNPYPSALDATKFIRTNTAVIDGTLYFWEHTGELATNTATEGHNSGGYLGGYSTRNLTMGIAANTVVEGTGGLGNATYRAPGRYIAVAQGFFVGGSETGGNIVFDNSQRIYQPLNGSSSIFFKGKVGATKTLKNTELPIIKLGFEYTNTEGQTLHRQIGISFKEGNTDAYESGYDSEIYDLNTAENDMYWNFGTDKNYVIAGVEAFNIGLEIPLTLQIILETPVTIKLDAFEHIEEAICLYDALTNTTTDLKKESEIRLLLAKGTYTNRFYLSFKKATLGIEEQTLTDEIQLYYSKNNSALHLKSKKGEIQKVTLYNLIGQKLQQWHIKNSLQTNLKLKVNTLPMGLYIVKIKTKAAVLVKKIVIHR